MCTYIQTNFIDKHKKLIKVQLLPDAISEHLQPKLTSDQSPTKPLQSKSLQVTRLNNAWLRRTICKIVSRLIQQSGTNYMYFEQSFPQNKDEYTKYGARFTEVSFPIFPCRSGFDMEYFMGEAAALRNPIAPKLYLFHNIIAASN